MRVAAFAAALALACSSSSSGPFAAVPVTQHLTGVPGLSGDVDIVYDGLGVPHIYAGSDGDGAFALGYAQARDRLFQMDLFRKTATGRLGELLGANAPAQQDILLRTMFTSRTAASSGSHHVEDLIAEQLDATVRDFVQRYADGVNRWIADVQAGRNGAFIHPQYLALGISAAEIAPWTVQDSIAIGRLQSFQLSDTSRDEILAGQLAAAAQAGAIDPKLYADVTRRAQRCRA
jgi:penicillin amidase